MRARFSRSRWATLGLASTLVLGLATSCFLKPKKKGAKKVGGVSGLIVTQENNVSAIFFDRLPDGDAAQLKFKTVRPALCELAYYSQDANVEPKKDAPKIQACSGTDARTEFVEKIEGLRTDTLYEIVITAWEPGSDKAHGESVTVRETSSTTSPTGDGKLKDLLVARLDIPLMAAEFHRNTLPEALDLPTIKTKLARATGCKVGVVPSNDAPFRDAATDIGITGLATRDFAAGSASKHPDQAGRLQATFPSLNDGVDKWTLIYQQGGKDLAVPARPMARILNMEMESGEIVAFDQPQLAEAEDPLPLDKTKPLKFAWTTGNLLDQSYMTVTVGRPDNDKAIFCVWPAEKKAGQIEPALLEQLDDGRSVVLAELSTNQLWAKDGWLIAVYDWRSGRIEKQ
jgi:hypothetical protein